jgi:hypothetical protein
MVPEDDVQIETIRMSDIGLEKAHTPKTGGVATFLDSQGTRKASLAETAVLTHGGRNEMNWGWP